MKDKRSNVSSLIHCLTSECYRALEMSEALTKSVKWLAYSCCFRNTLDVRKEFFFLFLPSLAGIAHGGDFTDCPQIKQARF